MSFGGAASAMVTSLKNNKRVKRKSYFKKCTEDSERIVKKASVKSKEQRLRSLADKRQYLNEEYILERKWRIITISVFIIFFVSIIYYYKDLLL